MFLEITFTAHALARARRAHAQPHDHHGVQLAVGGAPNPDGRGSVRRTPRSRAALAAGVQW